MIKLKKMILEKLIVSSVETNCYIIGCERTLEGTVIDPGEDKEEILRVVKKHNLDIKYIINTHAHIDHIAANKHIKDATGAKICMHEDDIKMLSDSSLNLSYKLYPSQKLSFPEVDITLKDGDEIKMGDIKLSILHTPGHTPGCISIVTDRCIFTGDTLFLGSIGSTDFPLSSEKKLIDSIKRKIFKLPDDFIIYPGHGSSSTIGREKSENPYLL